MTTQISKEKLTGTLVTKYDYGRISVVDAAVNQPLYDEISGDELLIPGGWIVALVDGATAEIKLGNNKVWSEAFALGPAPAEPAP